MNALAISANDIITNQALYLFNIKEQAKDIEEKFINDYALDKAEKLINQPYCQEYENFINEITWIDSELADRFFKLEKKLLTYKRIYRLRQVMKSILLELAILYYTDKCKQSSKELLRSFQFDNDEIKNENT